MYPPAASARGDEAPERDTEGEEQIPSALAFPVVPEERKPRRKRRRAEVTQIGGYAERSSAEQQQQRNDQAR